MRWLWCLLCATRRSKGGLIPRRDTVVLGLIENAPSLLQGDLLLNPQHEFIDAFSYLAPTADMPTLLAFMTARVQELGGQFVQQHLRALEEARSYGWLVVNCSGLGARWLCHDDAVYGQQGLSLVFLFYGIHQLTGKFHRIMDHRAGYGGVQATYL